MARPRAAKSNSPKSKSPTRDSSPPSRKLKVFKDRAKWWVRTFKNKDPFFTALLTRIQSHHPKARDLSFDAIAARPFTLADAQLLVARDEGFPSWTKLKHACESTATPTPRERLDDAIKREDLRAVEGILDAEPSFFSPALWPVVVYQARSVKVTRYLLKRGLDPNLCTAPRLPIHLAAYHAMADIIELLIAHGADVHRREIDGCTPLEMLNGYDIRPESDKDVLRSAKALVKAGAPYSLHVAARMGDLSAIRKFLSESPELLNTPDAGIGMTPLMVAARAARPAVVRELLSRGADLGQRCDLPPKRVQGNTPLWFAAQTGSPDLAARLAVINLLLAAGADVNARCEDNTTPLHFAAWRGPVEVVALLLAHDADPSVIDKKGHGPLHYARTSRVSSNSKACVAALESAGAV